MDLISREAEQAVIGALLADWRKTAPDIMGRLLAQDFAIAEYRTCFEAARDLYFANKPVDIVVLAGKLGGDYKPLLAGCLDAIPALSAYGEYVRIVKDNARRRRAFLEASQLVDGLMQGEDMPALQRMATAACECLTETDRAGAYTMEELLLRLCGRQARPREYYKTGIAKLDGYTYLDRGDYMVVGGRPSSGKTALTLQMALHMARSSRVAYFSLETSGDKLCDRMAANFFGLDLTQIKTGQVSDRDWALVAEQSGAWNAHNLVVVDAAGWTVQQIKAKAVQEKAEIIFIDYLGLVKAEGKGRYEQATSISIDLHTLAQQSGITVIALSQLSRNGAGEANLTDLRESGQIEQDADVVLLLSQTDEDDERILKIAKNKEGATGQFRLCFDGARQRFTQEDWHYDKAR